MRGPEKKDDDLFLEEVKDVRPLARRGRVPARAPAPPRLPADPDSGGRGAIDDVSGAAPLDVAETDEWIEGRSKDLDPAAWRKLRRGELAVHGRLDLHGLTADEARARVVRFVLDSRRALKRVVLVVHGRGRHSDGGVPVLKERMKGWLGPLSRHVLAFCTARPKDGGTGAVYVLLRK